MTLQYKPDIAISIDVESTGRAVLKHSCRQLAAAAFYLNHLTPDGFNPQEWMIDSRCWAIAPQAGKEDDPVTMTFLHNQPGLMEEIEKTQIDVSEAIGSFCSWYDSLTERYNIRSIIASPSSFDYAWLISMVDVYKPDNVPHIALPIACRDLTTMKHIAEKIFGIDTRSNESVLHRHGFGPKHNALNDALRQAWQYLILRSEMSQHKSLLRYGNKLSDHSMGVNSEATTSPVATKLESTTAS